MLTQNLTPQAAVDQLIELHARATATLKSCLERYFATRQPPTAEERSGFCYPQLRVTYESQGVQPSISRAFAKFQGPGTYVTTVTQPAHFRRYLVDQLSHLVKDYAATIQVGVSLQEIPYPYVLDKGDDLGGEGTRAAELALHFPVPRLDLVGDEIADGNWDHMPTHPLPLAMFDAVRVDYSLKRIQHYTGTHWGDMQPWILLTNYHRYVDQFIVWGVEQLAIDGPYESLHLPGGGIIVRGMESATAMKIIEGSLWHRYQMPAYHLKKKDGMGGGVTLVNIGVGPSNAKTMTDHLAVLRPHCWLMIGHCGGLRQSQRGRLAEAGTCPCHQSNLAFQVHTHLHTRNQVPQGDRSPETGFSPDYTDFVAQFYVSGIYLLATEPLEGKRDMRDRKGETHRHFEQLAHIKRPQGFRETPEVVTRY